MGATEHAIQFPSAGQSALQLEGRLHLPPGRGPFPAVAIAHPHSRWGGSMHAELVFRIARTLAEQGCAALRLNFRGVGRSEGRFDEGRGEVDDLTGALDLLSSMDSARGEGTVGAIDAGRLAVVGYSFGAWVGGQVTSRDERVRAFVAVALPVSEPYAVDLNRFTRPKCFITGANDTLCPPESLRHLVSGLPEPKTLRIIPDTDHFLLGCEQAVADQVAAFLASSLE